jgi:hypothetical protein
MAQVDFFEICLNPKDTLIHYQNHCEEWVRQNYHAKAPASEKNRRWIVDYDGFPFELGAIRINWSMSNKKLVKAFEKWLESNRPRDIKAFETRGTTQPSDTLKYLSAKRLLTVMTATEASALTQSLFGSPLYWSDDNWYAARTKANDVMKQISLPFFDWA